jgi:hypothetical protein
MKAIRHIAALTLLGLMPGLVLASTSRPLQLELRSTLPAPVAAPDVNRPDSFARDVAPRPARVSPLFQRKGARNAPGRVAAETRVQSLRRQALENMLDPAAVNLEEDRAAEGRLQLKFNKRGSISDLGKSYREMCDRVSAKLWDEPNGKRIRFDVAGKPGVGIEIPVGRRR